MSEGTISHVVAHICLGSIDTDRSISDTMLYTCNEITYNRHSKIISLEAMAWPSYIENHIIMRRVIMRMDCTRKFINILAAASENKKSAYAKTKTQMSCAITSPLISVFVFGYRVSTIPLLVQSEMLSL